MLKKAIPTLLFLTIVGISGVIVSQSRQVKAEAGVPDTADAKLIMGVMDRAYEVLANASQNFEVSEFSDVFIDTEDYKLTDEQRQEVAYNLGVQVAEVKNAGYLTALTAKYTSMARGAELLQAAIDKAHAENRELSATEFQELVEANNGESPSLGSIIITKTTLTFETIEINGNKAIVKYDDGAALQEAILVKKDGTWFIASIIPIWIHY